MTSYIKYQKTFSVEDCLANPKNLYVFGDNLSRSGKGGQAVIRDMSNSIGIATKRTPSMSEGSFFTKGTTTRVVTGDIAKVFSTFAEGPYVRIILPEDGLGTGRAQLPSRAPHLLEVINKVFYNESSD